MICATYHLCIRLGCRRREELLRRRRPLPDLPGRSSLRWQAPPQLLAVRARRWHHTDEEANGQANAKASEEADGKASEEADAKASEEANGKASEEADAQASEKADGQASKQAGVFRNGAALRRMCASLPTPLPLPLPQPCGA